MNKRIILITVLLLVLLPLASSGAQPGRLAAQRLNVLFIAAADPYEINNLVSSTKPEHKTALKRLRAALNKWLEEANDQGGVLEPPALAAAKGTTKPHSNPSAEAIRPHHQP